MKNILKERLGYNINLSAVSKIICSDFKIGKFLEAKIIAIGYEDVNFFLKTDGGNFFIKIFSNLRTLGDCERNVDILVRLLKNKISIPKLYKSKQGYLHIIKSGRAILRMCVMDFIQGDNLFTLNHNISNKNISYIAKQAALINSLKIKPKFIYDSWAIVNFEKEFKKQGKYLSESDLKLVQPLLMEFKKINLKKFPHCFVHGDIIKTNVIKDKNNKLWIIDFSVANYYPRIQELAVLACDFLFKKNSKNLSENNLRLALKKYQKTTKLTPKELKFLPLYIGFAHSMHVLRANYEKKINKNHSEENELYLNLGRAGLKQIGV